MKVVAVRGPMKKNQQDVDNRGNTGDREEGNGPPLRWWPGQDKVTSPDFRGFVIGKSTLATFMARYVLVFL